ncbi:MAG: DNA glycosylase [Clostridia bacterium]|nr:DNA glycosylase [Clostridia bacterium]
MNNINILVDCFNLKYTLECGQCFRWEAVENKPNTYIGVIHDRVLKITQEGNLLSVSSNKEEDLEEIVKEYFDLNKDYSKIEKKIATFDKKIATAVKNTSGIRHLRQDFFETLLSFIISANNNIPRITKSIQTISNRYGTKVMFEGKEYSLFPTKEQLKNVTVDEYRECGVGFRDRYLKDTVEDLLNNKIDVSNVDKLSTEELRKKLLTLKGVGPKVADCIMLFSCNKDEVFPIDVWVERVMSILYFKEYKGKMTKKDIMEYATKKFGKYAGIVQQHLFYNIREGKINLG